MSSLERALEALAVGQPETRSAAALYRTLARAVEAGPSPSVQTFPLPPSRALHKLAEGIPLLHDEPVLLDVSYAARLFSLLVNSAVDADDARLAAAAGAIASAAANGHLPADQLFAEAFVQHPDHLHNLAMPAGVDPEVLASLATLAVQPLLRAYAERLGPRLQPAGPWQRGYCPICGAWPVLVESRGVDQARHLRCGACGTDWRADNGAGCIYCGNLDPSSFGTWRVEGHAEWFVERCDRCHGYLNGTLASEPTPPETLGMLDYASGGVDAAAIERGYHRPGGAGYRIELALPEDEFAEDLASMD